MNENNKSHYISQIGTDVSLISFMAVISVFFNGALIADFNSYDLFIKVPLSFLIISTFGFIFSALILSNTVQEIINNNFEKAKKHILYGYAISEYLGVYLFILSVPLLVNIITTDFYLRIVTFCSALIGIGFYQFMRFSILEHHFPKTYKLFSCLIIIFGLLLFFAQTLKVYFVEISLIFIVFLLLLTYLAPSKNLD
jgi:hypothetical protein